eukprot:TRINITY_DN11829_c0_g1_i1.p1 TRINITY_DN11829_c0_g1~~TRINITY_DN11829_c0_g1_i1.p1  ORF type:complete len:357 (+),score=93.26 TRINITY_DN11829_c0_g1_i1:179-1249(+)
MPSTEREQASSLPSFLQRNELDGTEHIPMGFIIVAILIVIGAVGYAVRYLSRQQAEDAARKVQQANKRAARKNKKGKPIDDDKSVVEEEGEPLGALADAGSMVLGIAKEFIVVLLVVLVVVEGWRWIPRVAVVPCHHVLGRDDDGSKCVVVPGVEDPLECSMYASRPSPRGTFPTWEQHATRNCFSELPLGVLRPSSKYFWDSAGGSWYQQGFISSIFYRPWSNLHFVSPHKEGGSSVVILPKTFEGQLWGFYAKFNSSVLEEPEKIYNLLEKRDAIKTEAGKISFQAKTFAALHTKYQTGAMGAQISAIENGIDCAGAKSGSFQYILPRGVLDKWNHFLVDVFPDLYYFVSSAEY